MNFIFVLVIVLSEEGERRKKTQPNKGGKEVCSLLLDRNEKTFRIKTELCLWYSQLGHECFLFFFLFPPRWGHF